MATVAPTTTTTTTATATETMTQPPSLPGHNQAQPLSLPKLVIGLPRAQEWKSGQVISCGKVYGHERVSMDFTVLEHQNDSSEFRVFLGDRHEPNSVLAACMRNTQGRGYSIYLGYPTYPGQFPALRVKSLSATDAFHRDLFLWARVRGKRVFKVTRHPNPEKYWKTKEKLVLTRQREAGGKSCGCAGSSRVRMVLREAESKEIAMVRDQMSEELSLMNTSACQGGGVPFGIMLAYALDRLVKGLGSKSERAAAMPASTPPPVMFGLAGAMAAVAVNSSRASEAKSTNSYQCEVLNNIE